MANNTGLKFGGRTKNTPNKTTKEIRAIISNVVSNQLQNLDKDLAELSTRDRLQTMLQLLKFITPQMKAIEIDNSNSETFEIKPIIINLRDEKQ